MSKKHPFEEVARYRIKIKGVLGEKWADWFDGFTIEPLEGETILEGPVVDQGALHGLLAKIRDLGLTLLSVEQIDPHDKEEQHGTKHLPQ